MNETIGNQNGMYDEVKEVKNLNRIEGFDPRKYMRIIQEEGVKLPIISMWHFESYGSV